MARLWSNALIEILWENLIKDVTMYTLYRYNKQRKHRSYMICRILNTKEKKNNNKENSGYNIKDSKETICFKFPALYLNSSTHVMLKCTNVIFFSSYGEMCKITIIYTKVWIEVTTVWIMIGSFRQYYINEKRRIHSPSKKIHSLKACRYTSRYVYV